MSRIDKTPPKLTKALTALISARAAGVRDKKKQPPTSPYPWIATHGLVSAITITRWYRRAANVRRSGVEGPRAAEWIAFADAVDELIASAANATDGKIGDIAWDTAHKKQLDALIVVRNRQERHEAILASVDVEIDEDRAVAHISQEVLDALTGDELDMLERLQEALSKASLGIESIIAAANDRVVDDAEG